MDEFPFKIIRAVLYEQTKKVADPLPPVSKKQKYAIFPPQQRDFNTAEASSIFRFLRNLTQKEFNSCAVDETLFEKDLAMYSHFLGNNWLRSTTKNQDFDAVKAAELDWIRKNQIPALQEYAKGQFPVVLTINEAVGLLAKESKTTSNCFLTVHYCNLCWKGPLIMDTLNPRFDFSIPMLLGNGLVTISIWNVGKDRFLGQIVQSAEQLLQMQSAELNLQKRGKNSHVKGKISLKVTKITKEMPIEHRYALAFQILTFDAQRIARPFLELLYTTFFHTRVEKLSLEGQRCLQIMQKYWKLDDNYLQSVQVEIVVGMYLGKQISVAELDRIVFNVFQFDCTVFPEFQPLFNVLESQFNNFLQFVGQNPNGVPTSSQDLVTISTILTRTKRLDYNHIHGVVVTSVQSHYTQLFSESFLQSVDFPLLNLTISVCELMQTLSKDYDVLLLGSLHIPTIAAHTIFGFLKTLYQDFSLGYEQDNHELWLVMELYKQVRELQRIFEQIDYKLADKFPMNSLFLPFIEKWLSTSEKRAIEWVGSALSRDTLDVIGEQAMFSSSILDIFTSFQQIVDFIENLDWPDEQDNRTFYFAVLYDIIMAISHYCSETIKSVSQDLKQTRDAQPPPNAGRTAKIGKYNVKIPKMIRKKAKVIPNSVDNRLAPPAVTRLLNICAIPPRFDALIANIKSIYTPPLPPLKQGATRAGFENRNRCLMRITIVDADLTFLRPWTTKLAVRIITERGEIGTTRSVLGTNNPIWNEDFYAAFDRQQPLIYVGIVHSLRHKPEQIQNVYSLTTENMEFGHCFQFQVPVAEHAFINVQCEFLDEKHMYLGEAVTNICQQTIRKLTMMISEQLSFDFRERIHPISLKYKNSGMKTLFKDKQTVLSAEDEHEIAELLAPLFDFLNSNLGILMTTLSQETAMAVVRGIWNRFLADAEEMIVPTLLEDSRDKTPWDERRINFFAKYIQLAADFFSDDGQGLDTESLNSKPFVNLQLIIKYYFKSRTELTEMYERMAAAETEDVVWILKLLQMKGSKQYVNSVLKLRCKVQDSAGNATNNHEYDS